MRELEGLSHEEIAAALGLSGGGARQVIFRAREALRSGAGMLLPLPLMRLLLEHGTEATPPGPAGAAGALAGGCRRRRRRCRAESRRRRRDHRRLGRHRDRPPAQTTARAKRRTRRSDQRPRTRRKGQLGGPLRRQPRPRPRLQRRGRRRQRWAHGSGGGSGRRRRRRAAAPATLGRDDRHRATRAPGPAAGGPSARATADRAGRLPEQRPRKRRSDIGPGGEDRAGSGDDHGDGWLGKLRRVERPATARGRMTAAPGAGSAVEATAAAATPSRATTGESDGHSGSDDHATTEPAPGRKRQRRWRRERRQLR